MRNLFSEVLPYTVGSLIEHPGSMLVMDDIVDICNEYPMIEPFCPETVSKDDNGDRIVSYGLSSTGYDPRLDKTLFKSQASKVPINPHSDPSTWGSFYTEIDCSEQPFIMMPGDFVLGSTSEVFNIPDDLVVNCTQKSTMVRLGIYVAPSEIGTGFRGKVTLEIKNISAFPVMLHYGMGIAHFQFMPLGRPPSKTYAHGGRYMGQTRTTLPR